MKSLFEHKIYPTVLYVLIISVTLFLLFYVASFASGHHGRLSGFIVADQSQNNSTSAQSEQLYSTKSYYFYFFFILVLVGIITTIFVPMIAPHLKHYT